MHAKGSIVSALAAAVALTLVVPAVAVAQGVRADLVVTPAWVAARLNDPRLVVLHVAQMNDYEEGHVPGARKLGYGSIVARRDSLSSELPDAAALRSVFEGLGISDSTTVVVYAHEAPMATRVLFTLASLGHPRFALLDGGLDRWRAENHPLSREVPTVMPGRISARPVASVVVNADWVTSRLGKPGLSLVDTRTDGEYNGTGNRSGMPSAGHLQGAKQLEWETMFSDRSTRLKPLPELERMFAERVTRGDAVVTYCWVGYRASATWFVATYLGYDAKLYDGSYQDWLQKKLPTRTP